MKGCSICCVEKPETDFNWRNKSKGWLKSECRQCQRDADKLKQNRDRTAYNAAAKERKRKWRAAHPDAGGQHYALHKEEEKARKKAYRLLHGEELRQKAREQYRNNPEPQRKATREWAKCNRARLSEYQKQWYSEHKPQVFEKARRRRALKLERTVVPFSLAELDARMSVFGHCCAYCGGSFEEIDHVIPLSRGGLHCLANLRPACRSCNRRKWATPLGVWSSKVA